MAKPVTPETIKPFAPPTPRELDEAARPDVLEAEDLGDKLIRGKIKTPVGYAVNVDRIGAHGNPAEDVADERPDDSAWTKGTRLGLKQVRDHFRGDPKTDELIARLVKLGALVPFYE